MLGMPICNKDMDIPCIYYQMKLNHKSNKNKIKMYRMSCNYTNITLHSLALIGRGSGILVKYFIHSFVLTYSVLYSHQKSN